MQNKFSGKGSQHRKKVGTQAETFGSLNVWKPLRGI
jgi:hypothetical protein